MIDDVRPSSYLSSLPQRGRVRRARKAIGDPDRAWSGDVYRLVYFIDTFCQQLTLRTVSDNHGQSVVWRRRRAEVTQRSVADVAALPWEETVVADSGLRLAPFAEILGEVRAGLGVATPAP